MIARFRKIRWELIAELRHRVKALELEIESAKSVDNSRYLTDEGKARELRSWDDIKREDRTGERPPGASLGGYGYPDPDMYLWCDRINALRGVCTLQSCAGHRDGKYFHHAQLWLWFDAPTLERFWTTEAMSLSAHPLIERVHLMAQPYGHEVVDLVFHGNEKDSLNASMELICSALERIVDTEQSVDNASAAVATGTEPLQDSQ